MRTSQAELDETSVSPVLETRQTTLHATTRRFSIPPDQHQTHQDNLRCPHGESI
ncbi:hypothetical protein PtA15_10A334 [Puccinia triticina]|uniref:Uncharacterized protein n=1 Tax=Puccinia triticina TaxID=208348 RepID=A0ABY7CUD2_9BASI|nr:uncharacterized protein PtA15_10A334 [Puccinia triticina]WAQ88911.1 hypothetical protein PtA15_10A334 [Puccinia triticina]